MTAQAHALPGKAAASAASGRHTDWIGVFKEKYGLANTSHPSEVEL